MKLFCENTRACYVLFACLSMALFGCSDKDDIAPKEVPATLTTAQQEALVSRVQGRWRALESWDYAAAYEYATPNYRRVFPKSMYLNKFGSDIRWVLTGVDVLNYDAEAAVASVAVRVMSESTKQTTLATGFGAAPATINEKWFFIDGEWWNNAK
jgi:hypothetical protein